MVVYHHDEMNVRDFGKRKVSEFKTWEGDTTAKEGTLESEDVSVILFLITSLGEIYGFADSKGDLDFDDVNQYPFLYKDTHARDAKRFEKIFACFAKKFSDFLFAAGVV